MSWHWGANCEAIGADHGLMARGWASATPGGRGAAERRRLGRGVAATAAWLQVFRRWTGDKPWMNCGTGSSSGARRAAASTAYTEPDALADGALQAAHQHTSARRYRRINGSTDIRMKKRYFGSLKSQAERVRRQSPSASLADIYRRGDRWEVQDLIGDAALSLVLDGQPLPLAALYDGVAL